MEEVNPFFREEWTYSSESGDFGAAESKDKLFSLGACWVKWAPFSKFPVQERSIIELMHSLICKWKLIFVVFFVNNTKFEIVKIWKEQYSYYSRALIRFRLHSPSTTNQRT